MDGHLEGEPRLALPANDPEGLRPFVQVTEPHSGVMEFIEKFKWSMAVLGDYESCRRIAYENVEDAWNEGIDYIELRFSPLFMAQTHKLDPCGVVEAVCDGIDSGCRAFDIKVNLIGILSRTYGVGNAWIELQAIFSQRDRFVAVDLAGDEANCCHAPPPDCRFNIAINPPAAMIPRSEGESGGKGNAATFKRAGNQ